MKKLYEKDNLQFVKNGSEVTLDHSGKPVITFLIDSHDNRLTSITNSLDDYPNDLQIKMVEMVCDNLKTHFGGKEFVRIKKQYKALFEKHDFTAEFGRPSTNTERIRVTTPDKISQGIDANINIKELDKNYEIRFLFPADIDKHWNELLELINNCNFTPEKIDDYKKKGEIGMKVMLENMGIAIVIVSKLTNKYVGFCRVSQISGQYGYLADTWVNEKELQLAEFQNSKVPGTAYLYHFISLACKDAKISNLLLIVPPGRVDEFKKYYGCEIPSKDGEYVFMARFAAPQKELTDTFVERQQEIEYEQKSTTPSATTISTSSPLMSTTTPSPTPYTGPSGKEEEEETQTQSGTFER